MREQCSGFCRAGRDFNGDGKLDLVADGESVLAGNGDGTFRTPVFIQHGSVAIGDFNGNGQPDIANGVASLNSGVIAVLLNDSPGDGLYTTGVSSATGNWPVDTGAMASAFGVNPAPETAAASARTVRSRRRSAAFAYTCAIRKATHWRR